MDKVKKEFRIVENSVYEKNNYYIIESGQGFYKNGEGFTLTGFMSDVDAKLIAAAPDLLEALQMAYSKMNAETFTEKEFDLVEQAINKALSEEEVTNV